MKTYLVGKNVALKKPLVMNGDCDEKNRQRVTSKCSLQHGLRRTYCMFDEPFVVNHSVTSESPLNVSIWTNIDFAPVTNKIRSIDLVIHTHSFLLP